MVCTNKRECDSKCVCKTRLLGELVFFQLGCTEVIECNTGPVRKCLGGGREGPVVCPARELGHRSPGADFEDQDQDCGLAIIGFQTRKRSACDDVLLFWCRGQLIHWAAENAQYTLLGGPHPADGLPRL
ncbi:hypothetical protein RRG08_011264 [Elysia crispata]|uniref:Uncharacterized protein n=1 Tax=Elysia crispata TaxID=231223 RepID=A0AAE0YNQ8_9GAST|nr:hypothetical protein RRG08_011264 [Elysia crispata]